MCVKKGAERAPGEFFFFFKSLVGRAGAFPQTLAKYEARRVQVPARKSQLQGLKTCNRLGLKKRGAPGAHRVNRDPRTPQAGSGQNCRGEGPQKCPPQSNRNSELGGCGKGVVKKKKWIWLIYFFLFCLKSKTHPYSLTLGCQLLRCLRTGKRRRWLPRRWGKKC